MKEWPHAGHALARTMFIGVPQPAGKIRLTPRSAAAPVPARGRARGTASKSTPGGAERRRQLQRVVVRLTAYSCLGPSPNPSPALCGAALQAQA
jgi:hypothetical protein